jgi:hypothetical protein
VRVVLARADEERALRELSAEGTLQRRMRVTGEQRAIAEREVDVVVSVQILDVGAGGGALRERMRLVELEAGRDAEREHPFRSGHGAFGGRQRHSCWRRASMPGRLWNAGVTRRSA